MKLVRICMNKNYFTFRSEDYKQLKGARMGNSLLKSISDRFQIEGHLGEFLSRRVQKNLWFRPNAYQFPQWMGRNLYRLRIKNVFPTARIGVTLYNYQVKAPFLMLPPATSSLHKFSKQLLDLPLIDLISCSLTVSRKALCLNSMLPMAKWQPPPFISTTVPLTLLYIIIICWYE